MLVKIRHKWHYIRRKSTARTLVLGNVAHRHTHRILGDLLRKMQSLQIDGEMERTEHQVGKKKLRESEIN